MIEYNLGKENVVVDALSKEFMSELLGLLTEQNDGGLFIKL